jgi:hypothetical protein
MRRISILIITMSANKSIVIQKHFLQKKKKKKKKTCKVRGCCFESKCFRIRQFLKVSKNYIITFRRSTLLLSIMLDKLISELEPQRNCDPKLIIITEQFQQRNICIPDRISLLKFKKKTFFGSNLPRFLSSSISACPPQI